MSGKLKGVYMNHYSASSAAFRATETQRLIAATALSTLLPNNTPDEEQVETFARMMVLIQKGGFSSYFANGTYWSFRSRQRQEPGQVAAEEATLNDAVARFHEGIDTARGKAASRIRWNRTRRLRQHEQEIAEQIQQRQATLFALQEAHERLTQGDHRFAA